MWDLILLVPDHCLSFYFGIKKRMQNQNAGYRIYCQECSLHELRCNPTGQTTLILCYVSAGKLNIHSLTSMARTPLGP